MSRRQTKTFPSVAAFNWSIISIFKRFWWTEFDLHQLESVQMLLTENSVEE